MFLKMNRAHINQTHLFLREFYGWVGKILVTLFYIFFKYVSEKVCENMCNII